MTRSMYVSGGVGPPKVEVITPSGDVLTTVVFPESGRLTEGYELVSIRATAVTGDLVDAPRGYRYRVDIDLPAITLEEWKGITRAFSYYSAGNNLRFYPHLDVAGIYYDVLPSGGMALPYLRGKYLGYEGKVSFVGVNVLDYIPGPAAFSYFCSVGETGYDPDEISFFSDVEEEGYLPDEISYFSGSTTIAQVY